MLVYLIVFSKVDVGKEAKFIEAGIADQYYKFDLAYGNGEVKIPFSQSVLGVDFLVYDQNGKLIIWTDNLPVSSLEQFIISPSEPLFSSRQGEYLFKTYDRIWVQEEYKVIVLVPIRTVFYSVLRSFPDEYSRESSQTAWRLDIVIVQFQYYLKVSEFLMCNGPDVLIIRQRPASLFC